MNKNIKRNVDTVNPTAVATWVLTLLFVGLKLAGIINWSWWIVLCPIPLTIFVKLLIVALVGGIIGVVETVNDNKK